MKEFAVYTAARLGMFVVSYVVVVAIYLLVTGESQIPLFWPFLVAILISAVASAYLLRGQRERFALAVHERAERAAARRRAVLAEEERTAGGTTDASAGDDQVAEGSRADEPAEDEPGDRSDRDDAAGDDETR